MSLRSLGQALPRLFGEEHPSDDLPAIAERMTRGLQCVGLSVTVTVEERADGIAFRGGDSKVELKEVDWEDPGPAFENVAQEVNQLLERVGRAERLMLCEWNWLLAKPSVIALITKEGLVAQPVKANVLGLPDWLSPRDQVSQEISPARA